LKDTQTLQDYNIGAEFDLRLVFRRTPVVELPTVTEDPRKLWAPSALEREAEYREQQRPKYWKTVGKAFPIRETDTSSKVTLGKKPRRNGAKLLLQRKSEDSSRTELTDSTPGANTEVRNYRLPNVLRKKALPEIGTAINNVGAISGPSTGESSSTSSTPSIAGIITCEMLDCNKAFQKQDEYKYISPQKLLSIPN
jgi:hypothetical protein